MTDLGINGDPNNFFWKKSIHLHSKDASIDQNSQ